MKNNPFAKRSLGQNFLIDGGVIDKIVSALGLSSDDSVIEIGPGRGALTERLVESGATVIAIELDRELAPMLREQFRDAANFTILEADALDIDFGVLPANPKSKIENPKSKKLVANLPYYISTAILQRLIDQRHAFSQMVLMFQKEVVDRITAKPGDAERGFLTVMVEAYLGAEKLFDVPPSAFRPQPKVHSSVIRLRSKELPSLNRRGAASSRGMVDFDEAAFRQLVSTAFAQKRKTILNNLKHAYPNAADLLAAANINPTRRAETLTIAEWERLNEVIEEVIEGIDHGKG